ncbi:MAG: hypothetical protein ABI740_06300, partial [Alphaproteobacteria bacterium]
DGADAVHRADIIVVVVAGKDLLRQAGILVGSKGSGRGLGAPAAACADAGPLAAIAAAPASAASAKRRSISIGMNRSLSFVVAHYPSD